MIFWKVDFKRDSEVDFSEFMAMVTALICACHNCCPKKWARQLYLGVGSNDTNKDIKSLKQHFSVTNIKTTHVWLAVLYYLTEITSN